MTRKEAYNQILNHGITAENISEAQIIAADRRISMAVRIAITRLIEKAQIDYPKVKL